MFFLFLLRAPQETIKQPPPKESTGPKVFGPHGPREYTPESTSTPTEAVHDTLTGGEEIVFSGMGAMPEVPEKYRQHFDQFEKAVDQWLAAHTPSVNAIEWRSPSRPLKAVDAKQMDMAGAIPFLYSKIRSLAETISRLEAVRARGASVPTEIRELFQHQVQVTRNSMNTITGNLPAMPDNLKSKAAAVAARAEELLQEISALNIPVDTGRVAA